MWYEIAFTYIKKYWSIVLLITAIIFGIFFIRGKQLAFVADMRKIQEAHDLEIKRINDAIEEERRQHTQNIKKLQDTIDSIQTQYEAAKQDLDEKKRKQIIALIKKYQSDPISLAEKLSELTGFTIILPEV